MQRKALLTSNLAKGDIGRLIKSCRNLPSYAPASSIRRGAFGTPILEEGRSWGVSDGTIRKSYGGFLYALHCDRQLQKKQNGIFNPFKFTVTSAILVTHRR